MTQNQIKFWELQNTTAHNQRMWRETVKHNRNTESETKRYNMAQEFQKANELNESRRAHYVQEAQNRAALNEQMRHALAVESETARANRQQEAVNYLNATTQRLNVSQQGAYQRGQLSNERQRLSLQQQQQSIESLKAYESQRSHMAQERLTSTQQQEQARSNRAQEQLSRDRNILTSLSVHNEEKRTKLNYQQNEADRQLKYAQLAEQKRANETREMIQVGGTVAKTATDLLKLKVTGGRFR